MSDDNVPSHDTPTPDTHGFLFEPSELNEFADSDRAAGRAICKLLSALFVYTVLAMSIAGTWTYFAEK